MREANRHRLSVNAMRVSRLSSITTFLLMKNILIEDLELQLAKLANKWRKQHSSDELDAAESTVVEYHFVFMKLWGLGWKGEELLPDSELPESLMPKCFLEKWSKRHINLPISQDELSEIQSLEIQAKKLAGEWWRIATSRSWQKAEPIRQKYYTILERLYKDLKWHEPFEPEDELPEELMPDYYLKLFPHEGYYESFGTDFMEHYDNLYKKTGNEYYNLRRNKDKPDDSE